MYIDRDTFKNLEAEVEQIKEHMKQNDKKIEECKLYIFMIFYYLSLL
jgi:peptidoglycan hydrolase CwlO-like protein